METHNHDHTHEHEEEVKKNLPVIISSLLLFCGLAFDYWLNPVFFSGYLRLAWYLIAYILVAFPVIRHGVLLALKGDLFSEFFLMSLATVGAFCIGQYPEGVAVMLFYTVGEFFQDLAVGRSRKNIKKLLDQRPLVASVFRNESFENIKPQEVLIGETIQVKAGEKVPLDGMMLSDFSSFNTSALTGESKPKTIRKDEVVLAGMLNLDWVIDLKVTKSFFDSSLSRVLDMVQEATAHKAPTELFIRKFAKVYTPLVVLLAALVVVVPFFFLQNYSFNEWVYRALLFLVVSCPCALVISIPLGYFGGIGAASRSGILFKGSNYLDLITKVNTVAFDKTGTLTEGVFKINKVTTANFDESDLLSFVASLESKSTHPIAKAVLEYANDNWKINSVTSIEEFPGEGLCGEINGTKVLAGNARLMNRFNISLDHSAMTNSETTIIIAIGGNYAGFITIADRIRTDSKVAIAQLKQANIKTLMLSGDKNSTVQEVANKLGVDTAFGDLLPDQKMQKLSEIKTDKTRVVAFVGDGINDAPVMALSDIGIAMGGMGSDITIETADIVIQTDQPAKIASAIEIGRVTKKIVWQNISLAFGVKLIVLTLGAIASATMWEAVFADVGVALLAILNAVRVQQMKF